MMTHDGAARTHASAPAAPHAVAAVFLRLARRQVAIAPSGLAPAVPAGRVTLQPTGASKVAFTVTVLHVDRCLCVHTPAAVAILAVAAALGQCRRRRNDQHEARS